MRLGASWFPAVLLAACGTVDPGPQQDLTIRSAALPDGVVGRDYQERNVVLEVERGSGPLSWSLPQLPSSLAWLSVGESTGRLTGKPLEVVAPSAPFVVQVTNGTATTQQAFALSVGCQEGATSPCGVPDASLAMCVAGTRVCLSGTLGSCSADVGRPPYEADARHCGQGCDALVGAPPSCAEGSCRYACAAPRYHDCTGGTCRDFTTDQDGDGCETDYSSPLSCDGPGRICPTIDNADPTCTLNGSTGHFECGLRCRSGFDPDPCGAPPVCKPLGDPDNCGVCGRACPTVDTPDEKQHCSATGKCCMRLCDPGNRPACGPEICQ